MIKFERGHWDIAATDDHMTRTRGPFAGSRPRRSNLAPLLLAGLMSLRYNHGEPAGSSAGAAVTTTESIGPLIRGWSGD